MLWGVVVVFFFPLRLIHHRFFSLQENSVGVAQELKLLSDQDGIKCTQPECSWIVEEQWH